MSGIKLSVLIISHLLSLAAGMQVTGTSRTPPALDAGTCLEAVLVEPRKLQSIAIALESAVLAKTARFDLFTIVHGTMNGDYVQELVENSTVLRRQRELGTLSFRQLEVKNLGGDRLPAPRACPTCNTSGMSQMIEVEDDLQQHDKYSRILKSQKFWQDVQCDHMLLMQSDSVLCSNSNVQLSQFMQYEYVGGHTPRMDNLYPGTRMHLNGGLSFRNRNAMIRCINAAASTTPGQKKWLDTLPEDSFFSSCESIKQPTKGLVKIFSVDCAQQWLGENFAPFAVHKPWGGSLRSYTVASLHNCEGAMELYKHMVE